MLLVPQDFIAQLHPLLDTSLSFCSQNERSRERYLTLQMESERFECSEIQVKTKNEHRALIEHQAMIRRSWKHFSLKPGQSI